jgi:Family of unknown function (DUF5996)
MTLPELHLADWRATKDTLHLYAQIVGKIRLAATAPRNHWSNVPLYVDVCGLTTRRLHHRGTTFEIRLELLLGRYGVSWFQGGLPAVPNHSPRDSTLPAARPFLAGTSVFAPFVRC